MPAPKRPIVADVNRVGVLMEAAEHALVRALQGHDMPESDHDGLVEDFKSLFVQELTKVS